MKPAPRDIVDDLLVRGLHVETVRRAGLRPERPPHVVFQTSTLDALLAGRFDGDVTVAELAEHGDLGLGTLNGLDGEMIALDGRFWRADADGKLGPVAPEARTPFAVMAFFDPAVEFRLDGTLEHDELLRELERRAPEDSPIRALRIEGRFEWVRARSVPGHRPPYPPLSEIAHEQHVFEFHDVEGALVGFRFPAYAQGLEVPGHHLHFVDAQRRRGGHVLACRTHGVLVRMDPGHDLHLELPPGVELGAPEADRAAAERIRRIEGAT